MTPILLNWFESAMNILRYLEQTISKSMMLEQFSAQSQLAARHTIDPHTQNSIQISQLVCYSEAERGTAGT